MRITETIHPNTTHLDTFSAKELVTSLQAAELEVFGSAWGQGLRDKHFQEDLAEFAHVVASTLAHPSGKFILAGAGTSGRLALQAEITTPHKGKVLGCLAGGPEAFFQAKEGVEDSALVGMADLKARSTGAGPRVFLGITCGLSAAYVAGALSQAMAHQFDAVAILGFNPLEHANHRPLEGLKGSFRDLLGQFPNDPSAYLLNPILGPEPLTGSTRLKGGSATKIVLDLLMSGLPVKAGLAAIRNVLESANGLDTGLDQLLEQAAEALLGQHRVIYLTDGRPGLMALLDASECPPTFGAKPNEVQAYLGPATISQFPELDLRDQTFNHYVPTAGDATFSIEGTNTPGAAFMNFVNKCSALPITHSRKTRSQLSAVPKPLQPGLQDLLFKRQLNVLSTGAFVLAGKVWGNRMIDLRISNLKLFERACGIIAEIARVSPVKARKALVANITQDAPDAEQMSEAQLVAQAAKLTKLVPLTILRITSPMDRSQAVALLKTYPKIREGLGSLLESS